jgi:uncharacterized protein YbaR (Trm112 family)
MKMGLMQILACPRCKKELELTVNTKDGDEVISGKLNCSACKQSYKIEDGVPNLLPPEMNGESNA